jgi:hypothetical protein
MYFCFADKIVLLKNEKVLFGYKYPLKTTFFQKSFVLINQIDNDINDGRKKPLKSLKLKVNL